MLVTMQKNKNISHKISHLHFSVCIIDAQCYTTVIGKHSVFIFYIIVCHNMNELFLANFVCTPVLF